jgi:hypothetical protein
MRGGHPSSLDESANSNADSLLFQITFVDFIWIRFTVETKWFVSFSSSLLQSIVISQTIAILYSLNVSSCNAFSVISFESKSIMNWIESDAFCVSHLKQLINVTQPRIAAPFGFVLPTPLKDLKIAILHTRSGLLNDSLSAHLFWWTPRATAIAVIGIVLDLKFLHSFGWIHASLKPGSVLFERCRLSRAKMRRLRAEWRSCLKRLRCGPAKSTLWKSINSHMYWFWSKSWSVCWLLGNKCTRRVWGVASECGLTRWNFRICSGVHFCVN